ncbi:hypothetical protein B9T31_05930 [Acinetobacter sp. ANC 4558]|uniref:hypothetical protein n=1 Tax=Acinetobacter sp. ANC 4558 TaxID=1977876 RepID=UPI000A348163|nr:hypothetical protein [Acinetobacter sp. ANC 4558]OTG87145.1 hypothetical protein B9T31_05930 [Acinetobacter sp. ANC 4558]
MSTLFLIQSDFAATPHILNKLQSLYMQDDFIILMGEAVQFITDAFLQTLNKIYLLETDCDTLMNLDIKNIEIIQYQDFAKLCIQHTRCISLK